MTSERVRIFDTTLRDGEQSPGCSMDLKEKVRLARKLETLGVDIIEAGFPIASDGDFAAVKAVAAECRQVIVAALCRTSELDVRRAAEALRGAARPRIHTFVATSDIHLEYKLRKTRTEVIEMTRQAVRLARNFAEEVEFSAEDATRSDLDYLCEVFAAAVTEGATILNVPDTVGYTTPTEFAQLVRTVRERVVGDRDDITISVHCHNDLGLAVANSLTAIESGARQIECTVNGIGERAGNAALEELVMALTVRRDHHHVEHGINLEELVPTSELVLGKHSGRHALALRYEELGYVIDRDELDAAYRRFTDLADRKKRVYDQDLISLLVADTAVAAEATIAADQKQWARTVAA